MKTMPTRTVLSRGPTLSHFGAILGEDGQFSRQRVAVLR